MVIAHAKMHVQQNQHLMTSLCPDLHEHPLYMNYKQTNKQTNKCMIQQNQTQKIANNLIQSPMNKYLGCTDSMVV